MNNFQLYQNLMYSRFEKDKYRTSTIDDKNQ